MRFFVENRHTKSQGHKRNCPYYVFWRVLLPRPQSWDLGYVLTQVVEFRLKSVNFWKPQSLLVPKLTISFKIGRFLKILRPFLLSPFIFPNARSFSVLLVYSKHAIYAMLPPVCHSSKPSKGPAT